MANIDRNRAGSNHAFKVGNSSRVKAGLTFWLTAAWLVASIVVPGGAGAIGTVRAHAADTAQARMVETAQGDTGHGEEGRSDTVYVDVEINGRRLEPGALINDDRAYVKLEDVADLLGGRYLHDELLNIAFVLTGQYVNMLADTLADRNPELESYQPISTFVPGRGVHYGVPAPHVTVSFFTSGLVAAFAQIHVDVELSHEAWFDQPRGTYERFTAGGGYSQHLYLVDPMMITRTEATRVAFNGKALDIAPEALLWHEGSLYVSLRELARASGGGVGWDSSLRIATAKVTPGDDLTWATLVRLNERTTVGYERTTVGTDVTRETGEVVGTAEIGASDAYYAPPGAGLIILVDEDDRITGISGVFPSGITVWFPWYDQSQGAPENVSGIGRAYTQTLHVGAGED